MSVRLSDEEAWEVVEAAHTGILTSLRRSGWPVSLPMWFVCRERRIYVRTPERSKKVTRVRHDDRACFLVESGLAWSELEAVMVPAHARVCDRAEVIEDVTRLLEEKYAGMRPPDAAMPERTRRHYDVPRAIIELEPAGRLLTWDNSRLGLRDG